MIPFLYKKNFLFPPEKFFFKREKFWIKSLFWDIFWFHSGLWLTLILIILDPIFFSDTFYAIGVFIFWISHRLSPLYLAWGTKSFRPLCEKQKMRFVVLPFLIFLGVFTFIFFIPKNILPFSILEKIAVLFIIDFFWGAHHFAAQHYGILRLYQNLCNKDSSNFSKNEDRIFCWGIGGFLIIFVEILNGSSYLLEKNILTITNSAWIFEEIIFLKILGTIFVFTFTIFMIYKALLYESGFPKILYFLGIGFLVMSAFHFEPFEFLMLWTLQHWMVSIGLTSHMAVNDLKKTRGNDFFVSDNHLINKYFKNFAILFLLCTISIILTPFFEIEAVSINRSYSEKFFPKLMNWLRDSDWVLFLVVLGITTGFLHYWMDRIVFRFSDKETSKVIKKLLRSK